MNFSQVFGSGTVSPSDVAYRQFNLTSNIKLVWTPLSTGPTDYVARIMDVFPIGTDLTIQMPPASQVTEGYDVLWSNPGAATYTVLDNLGGTICTVASGQYVYIYLKDNSTAAGLWGSLVYGVGTGLLNAASVAGFGLTAISATINANRPVTTHASNYTIQPSDRASLVVWTSGTGTFTLPYSGSVGNGFYAELRNQGTGSLTVAITGTDTLDGSTSLTLAPNESFAVTADGQSSWYTVGRGRSATFIFSQNAKTVTGGTSTLSPSEAARNIQIYTGALTSNQIIVLPAIVNVYYVSNQTTGAYSLTLQSPAPGNVLSVPQGQAAVVITDGVNCINGSGSAANVTGIVAVANGGTGAATAPNALINLGAAPLQSPAFTGTPTVPTAAPGTNTTQAASTAFVAAAVGAGGASYAAVHQGGGTGQGTNVVYIGYSGSRLKAQVDSTDLGNMVFDSQLANYAPLASPAFTGTPTVPTAPVGTNSTQVASTAFVINQVTSGGAGFTPVQQGGGNGQTADKVYIGYSSGNRLKATVNSMDLGNFVFDAQLGTYQTALGFTPVQQGGGVGQGTNKVYLGWNSGLKLTVDVSDIGYIANESRGNTFGPVQTFSNGLNASGNINGPRITASNDMMAYRASNQGFTYYGSDGSHYIGFDSANYVTGNSNNFVCGGDVQAFSDERLKTNWRPVKDNFVTFLATVKSGVFDRTDCEKTQAGVSAQSLQALLPEVVNEGADIQHTLAVNYGAAAMVSCVELAKEIMLLKAEIERLKHA